jgi:hypothetical protein
MKNTLILFVSAILFTTSCKKSTDDIAPIPEKITTVAVAPTSIPAPVISAFNSRFAGASEVQWSMITSTTGRTEKVEFEVEFNHINQRHEARFDDNGIEKHHNITCISAAVPQIILTAFNSTHASIIVTEWKLTSAGTWKAHYLKAGVAWEATYSATGILLKEEMA